MWRKMLVSLITFISIINLVQCQFFDCHDDPTFDTEEGTLGDLQFTWLGALQYIHVKNGAPHYFRVPRVLLISRQFALSTAVDAAQIPEGFALGNIVFGDYERDEEECRLTIEDMTRGADCEPAILLMPIADVLLHPEYKHFGAKNSVALLKLLTPIKSKYMLPVCLPFKNYVTRKDGQTTERLLHVDFTSDVPRDFEYEEKEVKKLSFLPRELCYLNGGNITHFAENRIVCSTGCGLHSGAPSLVHEHTGHWTVVAMAQGGSPCPDPLRPQRPPPPPRHLLLFAYVPWITTAITGKAVGAFAKDDPFGFVIPRATSEDMLGRGWVGRWWMGGIRCYDRGEAADTLFRFYHEVFALKSDLETYLTYYIEIETAHDTVVVCVKVGIPYQLGQPRVWGIESPVVKIRIPVLKFFDKFHFEVEAWARNATYETTTSEELMSSELRS